MNVNPTHSPSSIDLGNYTLCNQRVLGNGATGTVYKGYNNSSMAPVAIKAIDLSIITDDATKSLLQNQKSALKTIQGPHVLKLLDIVQVNNFCYIVTDFHEAVTLKEYLLQRGKLSEQEAMGIFKKILIGCNSIIQNCIIHRDLKPANILISKEHNPTIIDFGFCQIIRAKKVIRAFNVGSPSYMSPEAYLRTLYSEKSDSWSLGVILYEMIHGKTLDRGIPIKQFFQIVKNNSNYVSQNSLTGLNANVKQILQKSFKFKTQERISISAMNYLADVYLANKKKEMQTAHTNINHYASTNLVKMNSAQYPPLPKSLHTLQNIQNQFQPQKHNFEGFISFAQFSKPVTQGGVSFGHRWNRSTQMRVSSASKQSFNNRNELQIKVNQNSENKVGKQHPKSFYQAKRQYSNVVVEPFSSKPAERRLKGPPVFRQVTVKYL